MKRALTIFLASFAILSMASPAPANAESSPRHAPNMYVDWPDNGNYDVMTVDWYCEQDALDTYWAVHNWDIGYAGFQNSDGNHKLLMSLWDLEDGTIPTIEYSRDGTGGIFGGEGTGKQVFTNYEWQAGKWYTMRVQAWTTGGKSYYGQWVCQEGGDWVRTAVISYPVAGFKFNGDGMFQEDFTFNNLRRSCRLRNAYGRFYGTTNWDNWNEFTVSNTYFPTDPPTWDDVLWNISYDCDWDLGNDGSYVWVQSGGGDFTSNRKTVPITYTVNQAALPAFTGWLSADEKPAQASAPSDGADAWAKQELDAALSSGIIPDSISSAGWTRPTTRLAAAEAIVSLVEKATGKTVDQISAENNWDLSRNAFEDTSSKYVTFLKYADVTNGVGGNKYDPYSTFTRAQVVTMFGRVAEGILGLSVRGTNPFSDVPDWAAPYVGYASNAGITNGVGGGKFDSDGVLQNQHTALFVYRALLARS